MLSGLVTRASRLQIAQEPNEAQAVLQELLDPVRALLLLVPERLGRLSEFGTCHDEVGVVLKEAVQVGLDHLEASLRPAGQEHQRKQQK